MRRGLLILAIAVVAACMLAVGSAPAQRADEACTWGASSMTAEWADGKLVESEPVTTGCVPPR